MGEKILEFLNYRLKFDIKCIASDSDMETWRNIENPTMDIRDYIGIYTKRNLDLTNGFIDDTEDSEIITADNYVGAII